MVSTFTAQLLASQDINLLFRFCVHPGPLSSHISQPLVASFDKTATAPQTEQYWQSCNSWCKIHAKAVTSIPFSKGIRSFWECSRWRTWQRHFYLAFPTKLSYYFQYNIDLNTITTIISVLRRLHPVRGKPQATGPSSRAISGDWIQFRGTPQATGPSSRRL